MTSIEAAKSKFQQAAACRCMTEESEFLREIASGLLYVCEDLAGIQGSRESFNFHRAKKSFARVCVAAETAGNHSLKYLAIGLLELAKAIEAKQAIVTELDYQAGRARPTSSPTGI